jgi:diguanylate cyclase (GGDEF)-like protein/PAS domain S-box-containing protein
MMNLFEGVYDESIFGMLILENDKFIECNNTILRMLKYKNKNEFLNTHPSEISPTYQPCGKRSLKKASEIRQTVIEQGRNSFEWVHKKSDGELFWVEVVLTDISTHDTRRVFGVWRDIRETNKTLEEKLLNVSNELEHKNKELEDSIDIISKNVIVSVTDLSGNIIDASEAFSKISGYSREELIGQPHNIVRHPDTPSSVFKDLWKTIKQGKEWKGELKNLRKDGSSYWVDTTITPGFNNEGHIDHYTSIRHDITAKMDLRDLNEHLKERKKYFKNLSHSQRELANTDHLTGIYNRRFFFDFAKKLIKISSRTSSPISMMMIDIDFFKKINDTFGHLIGDEIIKYLTKNIETFLRKSDLFARLGGEEFVILLPETDLTSSLIIAEKIRMLFVENIYKKDDILIPFTISIGVYQYKNEALLEQFIQKADEALYKAKNKGRNRVESI